MTFADLSDRAQVDRLRAVALEALAHYPVEPARLRLLMHDFNTTFRVDTTEGAKFALRVDVNRRKPVAALEAELAWLAAIDQDTRVVVPAPLAADDGRLHVPVTVDGVEGELNVAVMSWLPGKDLDEPTVPATFELGRQMAMLHDHASAWTLPAGVEFPAIDSVFMDSPDRLRPGHELISDEQRALLVEVLDRVEPTFHEMIEAGERMPIHGDLHQWNVKWLRGKMSVFDFDDAGIGVPAQDLAITAFYLPDDDERRSEMRQALFEGYRTVRELPRFTDEQFNAALAGRTLVLLNELVDMTSGESRNLVSKYLGNVVARMRSYLDTGVYRARVPGVVPLS
ncbi:phosphotransferase enzyme family protein [Ilumatobacter sp.]|uniref:phosphotransferase enzyme family protein n=1 Tax=Ilumatobacter sp. TaxID=1967498 RepID=UPI003AF7ED91